jgi:hypothetical protein
MKNLQYPYFSIKSIVTGDVENPNTGHYSIFINSADNKLTLKDSSGAVFEVGGLSDGDKGDITVSGSGSVWTIDNDVVTYDKMQDVSQAALLGNENAVGGTVTEIPIVDQYLPGGTVTALLENTANWDINGNYIGTAITGTFQGQSHYDGNYWFTAVADNVWIRLIRG